jgi:hypothetical protein
MNGNLEPAETRDLDKFLTSNKFLICGIASAYIGKKKDVWCIDRSGSISHVQNGLN